jgi:hypothetical protein
MDLCYITREMDYIEQLTKEHASYERSIIPFICLAIWKMNTKNEIRMMFTEGNEISDKKLIS